MTPHALKRAQLKGVVALWLTNRHEAVDACNDTRYEMFDGSWEDAARCTQELVEEGLLTWSSGEDYMVVPTTAGVFEAIS